MYKMKRTKFILIILSIAMAVSGFVPEKASFCCTFTDNGQLPISGYTPKGSIDLRDDILITENTVVRIPDTEIRTVNRQERGRLLRLFGSVSYLCSLAIYTALSSLVIFYFLNHIGERIRKFRIIDYIHHKDGNKGISSFLLG